MITSMKMKAFDAESVTSEMLPGGADTADPAPADSPDSSDKPRFSGRFHRRSIRRGSKYKMTHRSPTELSKVNILNFNFDTVSFKYSESEALLTLCPYYIQIVQTPIHSSDTFPYFHVLVLYSPLSNIVYMSCVSR